MLLCGRWVACQRTRVPSCQPKALALPAAKPTAGQALTVGKFLGTTCALTKSVAASGGIASIMPTICSAGAAKLRHCGATLWWHPAAQQQLRIWQKHDRQRAGVPQWTSKQRQRTSGTVRPRGSPMDMALSAGAVCCVAAGAKAAARVSAQQHSAPGAATAPNKARAETPCCRQCGCRARRDAATHPQVQQEGRVGGQEVGVGQVGGQRARQPRPRQQRVHALHVARVHLQELGRRGCARGGGRVVAL